MGRSEGKFEKWRTDKLLELFRLGVPKIHACRACGVNEDTFYEWMHKGRAGNPKYAEFAEAAERAFSESIAMHLATVVKAARDPKHWTAAAWILERRHPEFFGRKQELKVEGTVTHMTVAEKRETIRKLKAELVEIESRMLGEGETDDAETE